MNQAQRSTYLIRSRQPDFQRLVAESRLAIDRAAFRGKTVVSMSWGKDSCAMGHLAISALGRCQMIHLASAYEIPGGEHVEAYFRERADVSVLESSRTLPETIEWLKDVGLPHDRTRSKQGSVVQALKKDRGREWCTEQGFTVQLLGMRASESKARKSLFTSRGMSYDLKCGIHIVCPLARWTSRDVWAYLVSNEVPWHPLYDKETHGETRETIRNAGWLSTDGAAQHCRISWLRMHYPEQFQILRQHFPEVQRLS